MEVCEGNTLSLRLDTFLDLSFRSVDTNVGNRIGSEGPYVLENPRVTPGA